MRPTGKVSKRIKPWPYWADISIKETDEKVLVPVRCVVPEAFGFRNRGSSPKEPPALRNLLGWVVFVPPGFALNSARSVNC